MPLFALISGYLFAGSITRHSPIDIVRGKFNKLIIPCIFWAFALKLLDAALSALTGMPLGAVRIAKNIVWGIIGNFWFYKAIFFASLCCLLIEKYIRRKSLLYLILCICTIFAPDFASMGSIAFIFPYFVIGLELKNYKGTLQFRKSIIYSAIVLYALLIYFYKIDYYIYKSGMNILCVENQMVQIWNITYRFLTGISGSIAAIGILGRISEKLNTLSKRAVMLLSSKTGDIYVLSSVMFIYSSRLIQYLGWHSQAGVVYGITVDLILIPVSIALSVLLSLFSVYLNRYVSVKKWILGI